MRKLFLTIFAATIACAASAQGPKGTGGKGFEGTIEFRQIAGADTTNLVYYIKGDKVRIDNIRKGVSAGGFLFDLKAGTITSLNAERKIYSDVAKASPATMSGKAEVTKTKNMKKVLGYNCTEYIVKNATDNVSISYWMASGKFDFFDKLVKLWNRKDKVSVYFTQLTGVVGMFPMVASQTGADGKEELRLEVTKVEKKVLDPAMVAIPANYSRF